MNRDVQIFLPRPLVVAIRVALRLPVPLPFYANAPGRKGTVVVRKAA